LSAPVRFLAVVIAGWAGIRAVTLGLVPGFTVSYASELPRRNAPPIVATQFPPLPPVEAMLSQSYAAAAPPANYPAIPTPIIYYASYPYPYPPAASPAVPIGPRPQWQLPSASTAAPQFYSPIKPIDQWEVSSLAELPQRRSTPVAPAAAILPSPQAPLDRVQMSSWALLRGAPSPGALATGGTLGGSQAGARLTYAFNRWVSASLRTTSPVGGSRGAEIAAGARLIPFRSLPIAITAERRQSISPYGGGRSAFALFAEGGLYHQPMPWDFSLDAYLQAGVVGLKSRDLFVDGSFAFTRPVWGRISAGFGVWGGAQPGLYRVDAGPRISVRIRNNIYAHADWRQKLVGNAQPASGPALTLAADF